MPDPILVSRLAALERDLRVLSDLEALKDRLGLAKVRVHKRIWNGYQYTIIREISALVEKRIPRVRNQMAKAEAGGKHAGDRARVAWKLYAAIYRKSRWISQECLEFIAGLAFRDKKLDEQICQIADALIESYAEASGKEPSLAVPSSQESLSRTLGRIGALAVPRVDDLDAPPGGTRVRARGDPRRPRPLALLAGELPALMAQYPGGALPGAAPATPEESRKRAESYLIEFMADAFATYIMGPAYPCAAILLRFDPRAGEGQENSPIDLDRARVVLKDPRLHESGRRRHQWLCVRHQLPLRSMGRGGPASEPHGGRHDPGGRVRATSTWMVWPIASSGTSIGICPRPITPTATRATAGRSRSVGPPSGEPSWPRRPAG